MNKEMISSKQGISMIVLYMIGSALVLGSAKEAKADIWIAILVGIVVTIIIIVMYCRILTRFPNNNLYQVIILIFGRYIGTIICLLYIFYSLYLAALILLDFSMFISIVGLESTPESVVAFMVILLVIVGVKMGVEVLGRFAEFFIKIIYPVILLTVPLMLSMVNVNNLKPVLANGFQPVLEGAFSVITFPFAEIIIFTMIFSSKSVKEGKLFKVFAYGLLLGGGLIFVTEVATYLSLGPYAYESAYFPVYSALSRINLRDILQRVEIVIAVSFLLGGFLQISACLLACCNGMSTIMKLKDYRFIVTPIGMLVLIISLTTYNDILESMSNMYVFRYFDLLMQIILPIVILIAGEIRIAINNKTSSNKQ
jgi:spore germination protein KB